MIEKYIYNMLLYINYDDTHLYNNFHTLTSTVMICIWNKQQQPISSARFFFKFLRKILDNFLFYYLLFFNPFFPFCIFIL